MSDLDELIERAKAGETGHALDGQIATTVLGWTYERRKGDQKPWWRRPDGFRVSTYGFRNLPPAVTTSLDAQELLPGRVDRVEVVRGRHNEIVGVSAVVSWGDGRWAHVQGCPTEKAARLACHLQVYKETHP